MLRKLLNKNREDGFTIIEVMIVLAIAGLILVVVLIAIPQLQRNQRNESRRSVASRITTEINNFAGNNNGRIPEADATGDDANQIGNPTGAQGFFVRYLGCTPSASPADCSTNIDDPQTDFPVGSGADGTANGVTAAADTDDGEPGALAGDVYYGTGVVCDGELAQTAGATSRNFAFIMRLEGGAAFCLDNR